MSMLIEGPPLTGQGDLPPLREHIGFVEPRPRERLYPQIGTSATTFLRDGRRLVKDGKLLIDTMLANGYQDIEGLIQYGYDQGYSTEDIIQQSVGEVTPYTATRPRLTAEPGETVVEFALRLRPHQIQEIKVEGDPYQVRLTCDGRYDPEIYLLDTGSVSAGLDETGEAELLRDTVDVVTLHTLKNGIPFNGMRVKSQFGEGDPFDEPNYYASRSQTPTIFDMYRRMGKHFGEAVYTHMPYVRAMEQVWAHFNPAVDELGMMPPGIQAFRRGGIMPQGSRFSVYGDDRNNGRQLIDYVGRDESLDEDERTAFLAAMQVPQGQREQQYADTKVHLRAAGESGWDMSLSRFANGGDLSKINTTNIIPLDLQCMMIDGGRMLAHSYRLLAEKASREGDAGLELEYLEKEQFMLDDIAGREQFLEEYAWDELTGTYHDVELVGPDGPYDSVRSYTGFRRVQTVSAATGHVLRSLAASPNRNADRLISAARVARTRLFGPGGVAVTDTASMEQWDGKQGWAHTDLLWVEYPEEAAALLYGEYPELAEELLQISEEARQSSLNGSEQSFNAIGMIAETNNTHMPGKRPVRGEYPKDPKDPDSPQNFAMQAEKVLALSAHDVRARFARLLAAKPLFGNMLMLAA